MGYLRCGGGIRGGWMGIGGFRSLLLRNFWPLLRGIFILGVRLSTVYFPNVS